MLREERSRAILEMLQTDGRVLVRDLAKRLRTSQITIRKDLEFLHHEGNLERTHGGALPVRTGSLKDRSLQEKERLHRREKIAHRRCRGAHDSPGAGDYPRFRNHYHSHCARLPSFQEPDGHHQRTNIAAELAGTPVEVILTGGMLRNNSFSLVGPLAEESLRMLSADLLFLGVDGFDLRYG